MAWRLLTLLLVASSGAACFYVPEISERPVQADSPPFVLGFVSDVVVDLGDPARDVVFEIDTVYDLNTTEQLDYRFLVLLQPDDPRPVEFTGTLLPRPSQTFRGVTEYEGPSLPLRRCRAPLAGAEGTIVTVTLELIDPLPTPQAATGLEAYVIPLTWRARLVGTCPAQ